MATIKAGTYRFNDVLTIPVDPVSEGINFTANIGEDGSILAECFGWVMVLSDFDSAGKPMGISLLYCVNSLEPNPGFEVPDEYTVYFADSTRNKRWYTDSYGEGIKTITIPADSEVSAEFAEWFSANASPVVETMQISGVWKFKDVVSCHPYETYQVQAGIYEEKIEFLKKYGALCEPIDLSAIQAGLYANCFSMGNTFGDMYVDGQPTEFQVGCYIGIHNNGEYQGIAVLPADAIAGQTINFGTEPQAVSAEFYNWLTANASQPMASITHNGEEIASLFPGQTATLKCAGMKMAGDVVVSVAELPESGESTGGLAINGIIEQYKVNAGATVNAGDFVEFVQKFGNGGFDDSAVSSSYLGISACKLDNNRVLVAYSDKGSSEYGKAVVLSLDDGGVTVGTAVTLASNDCYYLSAVLVSPNTVFVSYQYDSNQCYYSVLTVDGARITAGTATKIVSSNTGGSLSTSSIALADNKVVVTVPYAPNSSGYCVKSFLYEVNGNTATLVASKEIASNTNYSAGYYDQLSVTLLSENRLLAVFWQNNTNTTYAVVLYVTGTSISQGTRVTINNPAVRYGNKVVALSDNKAVVLYADGGNSNYGTACVLTTDEGGTSITVGTAFVYNEAVTRHPSAVALSEEKVLVLYRDEGNSYYGTAIVLTVDGTSIASGEEKTYSAINTTYSDIVAFSESSALAVHSSGAGLYTGITVDGTTITADSEITTYVQPATGRLHNVGVAATGGASGETVDVYVVG